jgi:hypothetical protein
MPSSYRVSSLIPRGFVVDSETHSDNEIVFDGARGGDLRALSNLRGGITSHPQPLCTFRLLVDSCTFTSSPDVFVARHYNVRDGYSPSASTRPCFPFARAEPPGSKVSLIISALRLATVPLWPSQSD